MYSILFKIEEYLISETTNNIFNANLKYYERLKFNGEFDKFTK